MRIARGFVVSDIPSVYALTDGSQEVSMRAHLSWSCQLSRMSSIMCSWKCRDRLRLEIDWMLWMPSNSHDQNSQGADNDRHATSIVDLGWEPHVRSGRGRRTLPDGRVWTDAPAVLEAKLKCEDEWRPKHHKNSPIFVAIVSSSFEVLQDHILMNII